MRSLLLLIADTMSAAVIMIPVLLLLLQFSGRKMEKQQKYIMIVLAVYLAAIFRLTGMPTVLYMRINPVFNWVPFVDIVNAPAAYIKNTLLNVLLFLPLGFMAPLVWKQYRSWTSVLKLGFGVSIFIESMQILTFRCTDIDDLITNSIGALLGFAFVNPILRKIKSAEAERTEKNYVNKIQMSFMALTAVAFAVMFFVSPFLQQFLWEVLWQHFL